MVLRQSPPTTSGVIVISGTNSFNRQTSDFPVPSRLISEFLPPSEVTTLSGVLNFTPKPDDDIEILSTNVTTSGIVVMNFSPNLIGEEFVPPAVGNARIFPVFAGIFPEQDRRIFPVLPQFSILTPGD